MNYNCIYFEKNNWNEFDKLDKNNLLILNLFFILFYFSSLFFFFIISIFLVNFLRCKDNLNMGKKKKRLVYDVLLIIFIFIHIAYYI